MRTYVRDPVRFSATAKGVRWYGERQGTAACRLFKRAFLRRRLLEASAFLDGFRRQVVARGRATSMEGFRLRNTVFHTSNKAFRGFRPRLEILNRYAVLGERFASNILKLRELCGLSVRFLRRTSSATRKRFRLRHRLSAGRWTRRRQAAAFPDASANINVTQRRYSTRFFIA